MRRRTVRALAATAVTLAAVTLTGLPAAAAPAPPAQGCSPPRGGANPDVPWAQRRLGFQKAWSFTRGAGVVVAAIDSGVDAAQPQLAGRLLPPLDVTGTGPRDCIGHGTAVAGIIVGDDRSEEGVGFAGVAPQARLLPIKQSATSQTANGVLLLARAIRLATDHGARVINVSVTTTVDSPLLLDAVRYAQRHDVVLVAAAGNETGGQPAGVTYPASYPGVIGVAAIDEQGGLSPFSDTATRVSVAAPGSRVTSLAVGGGFSVVDGTSFAAPFVTGVVALVRSYHPRLSAAQVVHRVETTADYRGSPTGLGAGVVNPYQAVTAILPEEDSPPPAPTEARAIPPLPSVRALDTHTRDVALALAAGCVAVSLAVLAYAVVVPRGRRRGWRPGRRAPDHGAPDHGGRGDGRDAEAVVEAVFAEPDAGVVPTWRVGER